MSPFVQQGDHIPGDLSLCQEHLEHFVPEYLLQSFDLGDVDEFVE